MTVSLLKFFYRIGFCYSNLILCFVMLFLSWFFGLTPRDGTIFAISCGFLFFFVYRAEKRHLRNALMLLNMSKAASLGIAMSDDLAFAEAEYREELKYSALFIGYCLLVSAGVALLVALSYSVLIGTILYVLANATSLAALLGGPIVVFIAPKNE